MDVCACVLWVHTVFGGGMGAGKSDGGKSKRRGEWTHQCMLYMGKDDEGNALHCNTLLKLGFQYDEFEYVDAQTGETIKSGKRKRITTSGINHFEICHPTHDIAAARIARKQAQTVARVRSLGPMTSKTASAVGETKYRIEAKAAQARCYIYCRQKISKASLDDPYYRSQLNKVGSLDIKVLGDVLRQCDVTVSDKKLSKIAKMMKKRSPVPIVVGSSVKNWVQAEFDLFKLFLRMAITKCQVECRGNPIGQAIHDCSTLADKHKYLAIGLQFVLPDWDGNMAVALSVVRCDNGTDAHLADLINKEIKELTGYTFKDLADSAIQDGAALGVARELLVEQIICLMHDNYKLGQSGIGQLVRCAKKKEVNQFPEGQELIAKLRKVAKHFSYASRLDKLHAICSRVGVAAICPKIDKNTTRIMSIWRLLFSMLRLWKAVEQYVAEYNATKRKTADKLPVISTSEWQAIAEMEASLNITKSGCILSQYESMYTGGYGFVFKQLQIDTLRRNTISVIYLNSVTESRQLVRKDVAVDGMHPIGRATFDRTLKEGLRRWCPKSPKDETQKHSVIMTKQDSIATMLDPRLCHGVHLSPRQLAKSSPIFADTYAEYAMTATRFDTTMAAPVAGLKEKPPKIHAETVKVQMQDRGHMRKSNGFGGGTDGNDMHGAEKVQHKTIDFFKAQALEVHAAWRIYTKTIKWEDYEPNLVQ